jgi:microcystin-dependent protein
MACSNCFNGCADVISDQCVKYTGVDITALGIKNGDNLLTVENAITDKILKLMDGTGIIPTLNSNDVCALVNSFMPCCAPFNLNVVLTAFLKSICALDTRLKAAEDSLLLVKADILALNANYTIPACITGVTATTDTHDVLQATMTKLCNVEVDLHTNYTRTDQLDEFIDAHIAGQAATTNKYNTRMIPWVPYPIFLIPNGAFDGNGAGIVGGPWEDIYICNGKSHSGIQDLRGRVIVGSTNMGPAPFDAEVTPGGSNPTWAIGEKKGVNVVPLTVENMPSHNHVGEIFINDPGHTHSYNAPVYEYKADFDDNERVWRGVTQKVSIDSAKTGLKGNETLAASERNVSINVKDNGGNVAHANIQPGMGAFYIMYIPKP